MAAVYKDHEVLWEDVENNRTTYSYVYEDNRSDLEIVNDIIEGLILKEEAIKRGLAATESEVDAYVASVKQSYEYPEVKEMMDAYFETAGMTAEEYFQLVRDIAPAAIAKQKLRDEIDREYCEEHGIEFTKTNPPQGMMDAEEAYIEALFEAHEDEIEYFIDVNE